MASCMLSKAKWLEHLNSTWVEECSNKIVTRQGVSSLYDKLIANNEIDATPLSKVNNKDIVE